MKMERGIVFDSDGTLVHTMPGIAVALNRALARMGREPLTQQHVARLIGCGVRNLCLCALDYEDETSAPTGEVDELVAHFCREYKSCWSKVAPDPYPGVRELIDDLSDSGVHLAVLSNKQHAVTCEMVRSVFGEQTFEIVIGHDGTFPRKPAPDALLYIAKQWSMAAQELVLIGDSHIDATTAQAADSKLILVNWGYSQGKDLTAHCPHIARSIDDLRSTLTQYLTP